MFDNRNLSTEDFIAKAKQIHGDKYDYSLVEYTSMTNKVKIICPEHGIFKQRPTNHIHGGRGCIECGKISSISKRLYTKDSFITKANHIHDNRYNYDMIEYIDSRTKVKITCPDHGIFEQEPSSHLRGNGCRECMYINISNNKKSSTEEFIDKAKQVHGDMYDYSLVSYVDAHTKIDIICKRCDKSFSQRPHNHLYGYGCHRHSSSIPETQLKEYISSIYNGDIISNDRILIKPLEIDVYLPDINLAFEFNGDYWHSLRPKGYHQHKTDICKSRGVDLIHIWESDWLNNNDSIRNSIYETIYRCVNE